MSASPMAARRRSPRMSRSSARRRSRTSPAIPGNTRAFDVRTGRKLWEFSSVAQPGTPGNETWGNGWKGRSGTNMWGFTAPVDLERGHRHRPARLARAQLLGRRTAGRQPVRQLARRARLQDRRVQVALPDGAPRHLGHRPGRRAGALIEVGRRQSAPGDRLDQQEQPVLRDRPRDRRAATCRSRNAPCRRATCRASTTTRPSRSRSTLRRSAACSLTYDDIVDAEDTTPEHARACRAMWDKAGGYLNFGLYTPFMFHAAGTPPRSTIQLPGGTGGVNWGGPAADPTTGMVYVNAQDTSLVGWVERKVSDRELQLRRQQLGPALRPRQRRRKGPVLLVQRADLGPVRRPGPRRRARRRRATSRRGASSSRSTPIPARSSGRCRSA